VKASGGSCSIQLGCRMSALKSKGQKARRQVVEGAKVPPEADRYNI
jgi:hypothetical protein